MNGAAWFIVGYAVLLFLGCAAIAVANAVDNRRRNRE